MCVGGALGRHCPSNPECDYAVLDLLTEAVELCSLLGIASDEHRVKGDAPFRVFHVAAHCGDPSPIAHCRDDQSVQQGGIDETVYAFGYCFADRARKFTAPSHDDISAQALY